MPLTTYAMKWRVPLRLPTDELCKCQIMNLLDRISEPPWITNAAIVWENGYHPSNATGILTFMSFNLISSECGNRQRFEKIIKGLKRNRCGRAPDRSTARSFSEGSGTCADFQAHPFDALEIKRSRVGACPRSLVCLNVSPLKQIYLWIK